MTEKEDMELELQLGDVIRITNPVNENLNQQTFIVDYIDKSKTYLINIESLVKIKVKITEDGTLGDGNIKQIEILSRADSPGYARQNGLLPGKWINIYFGGDYPVIITGEITNLEEDMIELRTTDSDVIYINFDYKGIPENLPIDNIEIREKPSTVSKNAQEEQEQHEQQREQEDLDEDEYNIEELEQEKRVVNAEQLQITVPVKDVKDQLREIIIKADQIVFGDDLGLVTQYVDVSSKLQRYNIETQVTDLLDDLLSTIPNNQRTPRVLNNIHIMIERFKQLREKFSVFDAYGSVEKALFKDATYKPLKVWLEEFNHKLYWILPVVKNIKKVYDVNSYEENNDLIELELTKNLTDMTQLIDNYSSNNLPLSNLYTELAPYFMPFNNVDDENKSDIILEKEVQTDLTTVIDNLEDLYSSVYGNNAIRNRRFVISQYNLGQTHLEMVDSTSLKMTTVRVKITNNDQMSLKSIMTLPEPTIRFSKINLPGTDMLTRANLNEVFLNYWQLLKRKTNVSNVFIEDTETEFDFNENEFVNGIRNYVLNLPEDQKRGVRREDLYKKYINTIVPKTRILFNLMKKYITGKLSIVDVVSYLEPFLIYVDDLTYNQYKEIVTFIDSKISEYNKNMVEFSRIFKTIGFVKQQPIIKTKAFTILSILNDKTVYDEVIDTGYQLDNAEQYFTNSEILRKIMLKDYGQLYSTAVSYENLSLMFSKDVSEIFESEKKENDGKIKSESKEDKCETIVIAKMYTSLEQLENDNDKLIFFDKKYDKTNYGVMEEESKRGGYAEQVISLPPEKLKEHIINDQMKKKNLSLKDADYIADTLIDGNKKVIDGQYAVVYKGYAENIADESDYYVRKNNKWVVDNEMAKKSGMTDEASILCDLQEKCINVPTQNDDNCVTMKTTELNLQNKLLNNIISEFDSKYKLSKEQFEKDIKTKLEYFLSIMPVVTKIETNFLLKYNNQKYKLGANIENEQGGNIVSPFSQLLDLILSQGDFIKKQNDIIKFADKFTRPRNPGVSINGKMETDHWLYCSKTNVPLLPAFKKELAVAFITSQYTYQTVLERIKASIGQLSDDGDWWTDKYSGWPICPVDFDTEEGYDEGFKVSTRAIMEEDAGSKIMSATTERTIKYITPEANTINNIINALSTAMGINIENQKEFIINCVMDTIKNTVERESEYKEKVKVASQKGKVLPSYRDFFNASLLYYSLGMFLIGIQTSIPSVKTRKTHPGCVRSFSGYPFEGLGDYSSLTYLACVTYDIRGPSEPWNVLKKTSAEKILTKIQSVIDNFLINLPDVQRKFQEKSEYLLTTPANEIAQEHDISNWSDFLPPLMPFKIKHLANISEEFKRSLINELKNGSVTQREKILVIESKIIQFSLAIQEKINEIVRKHRVLLHTANNEPYLENACCDSKENETTVTYFTSRDSDIIEYNKIVDRLANMLDDIRSNTEAVMFFSNINTKNVYPTISNTFNEKTIYLAFIFYCKFKSLLPVPEDLLAVCGEKPDSSLIDNTDTIERIIQKLKESGKNYSNEQFLRLIQLVSRQNIINIELSNPVVSCIAKLSKLLEAIYDENNEDEIIEQSLRDLIANAIDTFDIAREEYTPEVSKLNDFLVDKNEEMILELVEFVEQNRTSNISRNAAKKFTTTIKNLDKWHCESSHRNENNKISDDNTYKITQFYKTFIEYFIKVFPNIMLNKVNYDNVSIPKYYGFSKRHMSKLSDGISKYFDKLKPFYNTATLSKILATISDRGSNVIRLAQATPAFTSIKNGDHVVRGVIDEQTSRFLFEYYLLRTLIAYIDMADEEDMIVREIKKTRDVADVFSVDYIDETQTRIDLGISSQPQTETLLVSGNKRELKQRVAELLVAFMEIFRNEKDTIDVTYEYIQDMVFKLKEREKDMVTDRLKSMTDERREADNIMKITKQGLYSKGLQKGLVVYDKDFYEEEQQLRDEMDKAERKIRKKNRDATDENIDILVDEYLEQNQADQGIEEDAFDMRHLGENYYDGNYDGYDDNDAYDEED